MSPDKPSPFTLQVAIALTTTTQLLEALRRHDDGGSWSLLVERYGPVLRGVGRRLGLNEADAEDAAQQTLLELVRDLRESRFDRARGGLRRWTLAILRNRVRDIQRHARRAGGASADLCGARAEESDESRLEGYWSEEMQRVVITVALARLRAETHIAEPTIRAFELTALRGVPVPAVAEECAMSCDEVYVARNRVLNRLRGIVAEVEAAMEE